MLDGAERPQTDVLEPGPGGAERELPPPAEAPRRRRRRLAALAAVVLAGAAAGAIVLATQGSAARHAGDTGVPAGDTTATVTRRTLTESSTVDGTLGYGSKTEVFARLSGTFTWLPGVGARIARGGTLFRVDNTPVVLMYGSLPAYRTLKQGVSDGSDVSELNENLIALGYDPYGAIADLEAFGEATAAAVKRWQKAEGLRQTGAVELGRVVFAPSARRVTEVHVSLGQDPPEGEPASAAAEAPKDEQQPGASTTPSPQPSPKKEPSSGTGSKKQAPTGKKPPHKRHKAKPPHEGSKSQNPKGKEASSDPSSKGGSKEPSGKGSENPSGAGELALTTTSTRQLVSVALKAEQQQLARVGEHVPVTLPGGESVGGRITSVGTVASTPKPSGEGGGGSGGDESPTIPITIALDHAVAHLDEAPVSVQLVESVRHGVLTVPATALIATAGGGYAVEALSGDRRHALPVTPGMFAGGYVQVEGPDVHEGLTLIVSQ
jgi:peptidoglycan hydrolase-like protein with peptidoglycan-binding domain